MNFIRKNKGQIGAVFVILIALTIAFFWGLNSKDDIVLPDEETQIVDTVEEVIPDVPQNEQSMEEAEKEEPAIIENNDEGELFCTLSVRCDTIVSDISRLDDEKLSIIPKNGVIFAEKKVKFYDGESVFDLLLREMKNSKIHLEFVNTPIYGSVYIEGIGNIYEFDAGELSGWMYKVNGEFPNFGCSKYYLKQGDKVEFVYTCDLGKDVGGGYVKGQGAGDE